MAGPWLQRVHPRFRVSHDPQGGEGGGYNVSYLSLCATADKRTTDVLPALRDACSGRWVAAGFEAVVAYLRDEGRAAGATTGAGRFEADDLDAGLTAMQAADSTAYSAFLQAEAAPLLALSLYVSSANWSATTRPAYSHVLPFPLTWIEPPAVRLAHSAAAAHLGLSSLDTDADDEHSPSASASALNFSSSLSAAALQVFPDRLRAARLREGGTDAEPPPITPRPPSTAAHNNTLLLLLPGVTSRLTPEAKAQIRLDHAARACLSVLARRKGGKRLFLRPDSCPLPPPPSPSPPRLLPTSLDCLAFGYLALMTVPDVPRPFLADTLRRHYPGLDDFVADMRQAAFGSHGSIVSLPWRLQEQQRQSPSPSPPSLTTARIITSPPTSSRYLNPLWLRTVHGVVHAIPGLSGEWLVWLYRLVRMDDGSDEDEPEMQSGAPNPWRRDVAAARWQRLVALCATLTGTALTVGLLLGYRSLPPFGAPVTVFSRPLRTSLLGLGAAGAILSSL